MKIITGVIKETENYNLRVLNGNYQIINTSTGVVEKVGFCLPLMLHDIRLLQSSLDKELLDEEDLINLDQLYE